MAAKRQRWYESSESESDVDSLLDEVESNIERMEKRCWERLASALARCQPAGGKPHLVCRLIQKKHGQEDAGVTLHVLRGILEEWSPVMCAKLQFGSHDVETAAVTEVADITIDEFDKETMEHFTHFLYHGCLPWMCTMVYPLYHTKMPLLLELARMAGYYDIPDLQKLCMYYLSSISLQRPEEQLPSVHDFQSASFELHDLLRLGCHPHMLVTWGFSLRQFMEVQATPAELRRAKFSVEELCDAGCCTPNLAVDIFLDSKCSRVEAIQKMIRLGFSATELNEGGFNSRFFQKELQIQGSAILLSECGYGHEALLALGYSNRLLQRSGLLPIYRAR